jgi:hypothetical protein
MIPPHFCNALTEKARSLCPGEAPALVRVLLKRAVEAVYSGCNETLTRIGLARVIETFPGIAPSALP